MEPQVYSQIFTMHGTVMMFLFAIPFFEAMSMLLLPGMLGTRDLAFPRLGAYGLWVYIFGGSAVIIAMLMGLAPDGGWFMYPPLSSAAFSPGIGADVWLLGITSIEVSAIATAIEVIVTVLRYRAAGMSLSRMPIFAWYILVVSVMILTAFPPMILGSLLLEVERALNWPFFKVENGGDPLLWQHLFWLFGHPEVYIIFLPAAGMIATILPVMARTNLLGYGWVVAAAVSLAVLSFGLWVHHMFTTGIPHMGLAFFSAASTLVAVPTSVMIFFVDWNFVERPRPDGIADAVDHGILCNLRDRRADRGDAGCGAVQLAGPRHTFRGGASALCADRRLCLSDGRGDLLLHASAHRADAVFQTRRGGVLVGGAVVPHHVSFDSHGGVAGSAKADLDL